MLNIPRNIRFFMVAALCCNSAMMVAGEGRLPVPKFSHNSKKDYGKSFFALSSLISLGSLQGMPYNIHIHLPNIGNFFRAIDCSRAMHIVHDNKMMLSIAASVVILSLLIKQVQQSVCGEWCGEQYKTMSSSVDKHTNSLIEKCPDELQLPLLSMKGLIRLLCSAIKKYVSMHKMTIFSVVACPVTGRLLDCAGVPCLLPLLNYSCIGGGLGACIFFDGCFTSIEEKIDKADRKNMEQHAATQGKIDILKQNIGVVAERVTSLFGQLQLLNTGVNTVKKQVGFVSKQVKKLFGELTGIKIQVVLLHDKIDTQDQKSVERYEDLKKQLEALQESYNQAIDLLSKKTESNEQLKLEITGFKNIYQRDHAELRKDLGTTATHLSNQISGVEKKVEEGFASQRRALLPQDNPSANDLRAQLLLIELGNC